jgi:hypothetical protein
VPIPMDESKTMLLGYHYALRQQSKQLARERSEIQKRRDSAIAASIALHKACSDASYTDSKRHRRHGSRVENLKHSERQNLSKNLDSSFLSVDEQVKPRSPCHHGSPRCRSSSRRSRSSLPRQHKSPKHGGTRRSRTPTKTYDYEDDKKEMGASCFTHRVRTTPVPKGFKLPHD